MKSTQQIDQSIRNLTDSVNSYGMGLEYSSIAASQKVLNEINKIAKEELEHVRVELENYNDIIKEGPLAKENKRDRNHRHLTDFFKKYGLQVSQKILKDITDDCIIEINTLKHKQIFRSVNFFTVSSYDLGILTFVPWSELFHRPKNIFTKILSQIEILLKNNIDYMIPNIPRHILTEIGTNRKFTYKMQSIACVTDELSGLPMGYLTIISVDKRNSNIQLVQ